MEETHSDVKVDMDFEGEHARLLAYAKEIAERAHMGQVDKGGHPYMEHVRTVVNGVDTPLEKTVAYLHDVLEDTDTEITGFPKEVMFPIRLLTHKKNVPYMEYIKALKQSDVAVAVKKADLKNNMDLGRIAHPTEKDFKRVEKYKKALEILNE